MDLAKIAKKHNLMYGMTVFRAGISKQYSLRFVYPEDRHGEWVQGQEFIKNLGKNYDEAVRIGSIEAKKEGYEFYLYRPLDGQYLDTKFKYGKYQGMTVSEVNSIDPQYISWAKRTIKTGSKELLQALHFIGK